MSVTNCFRECLTKSGYNREKIKERESQSKWVIEFESNASDKGQKVWHKK